MGGGLWRDFSFNNLEQGSGHRELCNACSPHLLLHILLRCGTELHGEEQLLSATGLNLKPVGDLCCCMFHLGSAPFSGKLYSVLLS